MDDNNQMPFEDIINKSISNCPHMIITGWSDIPIDNDSSDVELVDNVDNFYIFRCPICGDPDQLSEELFNKIDGLLKILDNYLNIALVKSSNSKSLFYYKRVFCKWTEQDNKLLIEKIRDCNKSGDCNEEIEMPKSYLLSGVDNVSSQLDNINQFKDVLNDILRKIRDSISFFEIPFEIQTDTFHLYHPERSFPLPVLLKCPNDMPYNYWNRDDWYWGEDETEDEEKRSKIREEIKNVYSKFVPSSSDFTLLGYYKHDNECGCYGPHIVLCPENIEREAKNQSLKKELVYLIVLVHELAHAMMDKKRTERIEGSLKSLYARAMEESLANMITLRWFNLFVDKGDFNRVKGFIQHQPDIYRFGVKQYNAKVDWTKWRDSYKNMHFLLKQWFDTCFSKNRQTNTVINAYNKVFEINLNHLIELFKKIAVNKLEEKSIDAYCYSVELLDNLNAHETYDWFSKAILEKHSDEFDPLAFLKRKIKNTFAKYKKSQKNHISGCNKFAQCILGFYYANIWLQVDKDDNLFCKLVAKNALFASKEVVEDVKNGKLGSQKNKDNNGEGNKYASWDYMTHVRNTDKNKKGEQYTDKLQGNVVGDDNTIANLAIKSAIIESYKRKYRCILPNTSLFRDYEACHIWDLPGDRRYYASVANLILLPRALAKLTDHNDAVKELLRYEAFKRFGFKPDGEKDPQKPKNYSKYIWRDNGFEG